MEPDNYRYWSYGWLHLGYENEWLSKGDRTYLLLGFGTSRNGGFGVGAAVLGFAFHLDIGPPVPPSESLGRNREPEA